MKAATAPDNKCARYSNEGSLSFLGGRRPHGNLVLDLAEPAKFEVNDASVPQSYITVKQNLGGYRYCLHPAILQASAA